MSADGQVAIDGFDYRTVSVGGTDYCVGIAGAGAAVLLLHGFPKKRPKSCSRRCGVS
jgi:hypothetical protein